VALGPVLSKYVGSPFQFSFHQMPHFSHLISGAVTMGHLVASTNEFRLTPSYNEEKAYAVQGSKCHHTFGHATLFCGCNIPLMTLS
jgi:hypothetical protein